MTDNVQAAIQPDGSLFELGWYLSWKPGHETACLDGDFTADDLRAVADHMVPDPTTSALIRAALVVADSGATYTSWVALVKAAAAYRAAHPEAGRDGE